MQTQAADIRSVVVPLGLDRNSVVSHDIGIMVAYAYAARYPDKVERLVVMDAPIPGIAPWDEIVRNPSLWHFSFHGPDAERLVQGRERIYLDTALDDFYFAAHLRCKYEHPEREGDSGVSEGLEGVAERVSYFSAFFFAAQYAFIRAACFFRCAAVLFFPCPASFALVTMAATFGGRPRRFVPCNGFDGAV